MTSREYKYHRRIKAIKGKPRATMMWGDVYLGEVIILEMPQIVFPSKYKY